MSYRDATYVIFDGDEDAWAYRYMRGWRANEHVEFDFRDAHDIQQLTSRAQDEAYIKSILRGRMNIAKQAIVLIGAKTKNLFRYVRWEMELALEKHLPIVASNLNGSMVQDERCPAILRDQCVLHIPFKMKAIKYALESWPMQYKKLETSELLKGWRYYPDEIYTKLGIQIFINLL
jgi:hypothetical protein